MKEKCAYQDCKLSATSRGYCGKHYVYLRRLGLFTMQPKNPTTCNQPDCNLPVCAKGMCRVHYDKERRPPTHTYDYTKDTEYTTWKKIRKLRIHLSWVNSYTQFLQDMGRRPSPEHRLVMLDPSNIYSKYNCKWLTYEEQKAYNKRTTMSQQGQK